MPVSLTAWNWQLPDWPELAYQEAELEAMEAAFLHKAGIHVGAFSHLNDDERDELRADLLSDEAFLSSKIEGEILDRDSLQSSIRKLFGLSGDGRRVSPAERGISELLVDVYRHFDRPLDHGTLYKWHGMVARGRWDLETVGAYRRGNEPMRIVSGPVHEPVVHFEAPPADRLEVEMNAFLEWFNRPARPSGGLARAGIAHLRFESIHPFEDGNGRIGRALAEMALSQALGSPTLIALSTVLEKNRRHYYEALGRASRTNEVTPWLGFFGRMVLEAQDHSLAQIEFLVGKARFFDRYRGTLNTRQEKALVRMFREGLSGFTGGLSAGNYIRITGCSPATATRDLAELAAMGALLKQGELKHARYFPNLLERRAHRR
ncbi:MAG: Fic family protein [Akkermansiaceae bacterium]|jgi:Fic family protein|nr:Fic family protein [Akkermansiaceae bacterium]